MALFRKHRGLTPPRRLREKILPVAEHSSKIDPKKAQEFLNRPSTLRAQGKPFRAFLEKIRQELSALSHNAAASYRFYRQESSKRTHNLQLLACVGNLLIAEKIISSRIYLSKSEEKLLERLASHRIPASIRKKGPKAVRTYKLEVVRKESEGVFG